MKSVSVKSQNKAQKMKNKFFCLQNIVQKKCTFIKLLKIFYIKVLKLKLNSKSNKQIPTAKINHTNSTETLWQNILFYHQKTMIIYSKLIN